MKTLTSLIRVFEPSRSSDGTICRLYADNGQLRLKASEMGHCAVYEKELQRVWPITEENRKAKIAEFGMKQGFRLAYYKQGHCAIFLEDFAAHDIRVRGNRRDSYSNRNQGEYSFG